MKELLLCVVLNVSLFLIFPQKVEALTLFQDDFIDLNGVALENHNPSWIRTNLGGCPFCSSATIQNNQALFTNESVYTLNGFYSATDQCASVDVLYPFFSSYAQLQIRSDEFQTRGYVLYWDSGNQWELSDVNRNYDFSGINTLPAGLHNFEICAVGTDVIAYRDGEILASFTDAINDFPTGTVFISGEDKIFDNFLFTNASSPTIKSINAFINPVEVNVLTNLLASFRDSGITDTHTAIWDWGDGNITSGTVIELGGSGFVSGSHTYSQVGVYTVSLTITDSNSETGASAFRFLVVYDSAPNAGFVTALGEYDSLTGWYLGHPLAVGRVKFGIQAKYTIENMLIGQTKFNFKVGDLDFASASYQWLTVSGTKATLKGNGTINNLGNYTFLVSIIEGSQRGGQNLIRFQIKDETASYLIYDTQFGDPDTSDPITPVAIGQIKVH